ncbi:hypothetical protein CEXT_480361 [Caerostris extrusa]|uniref:Uncharacterized protein n=1 Tax=Caerostris extrusa TaxID=172846 RepID=A0AAV4XFB2_CAEEX|nr:hypothetical protein CEXT_480361 [Caerostris extrusa]
MVHLKTFLCSHKSVPTVYLCKKRCLLTGSGCGWGSDPPAQCAKRKHVSPVIILQGTRQKCSPPLLARGGKVLQTMKT